MKSLRRFVACSLHCIATLPLLVCCGGDSDSDPGGDGSQTADAASGTDASTDSGATTDAGTSTDVGTEPNGVTSTLVAVGCSAAFAADRVMVHYNTSLGLVFTDADSPYTVRGSISFDFPSGFTGPIPNPYSWVDSGIHKEVAVTDQAFTTWGNHCWKNGESPTGGSATIELIDGPKGIVRASFHGFQVRNCINQSATCTLTGTIESSETGIFE